MSQYSHDSSHSGTLIRRLILGVLIMICLVVIALQTSGSIREYIIPIRTYADDFAVENLDVSPTLFSRFIRMWKAEARVQELEAELHNLSRWRSAAISMAERLERYEDMLNLVGEPPVIGISARITSETTGPFAETKLANAGTMQGVEIGAVALSRRGLVGRVFQVGEKSSRILLISDFNSRVPVMGEESGVRGILSGGRGRQGRVIDKPEDDPFFADEYLLTSGEGGLFPRGMRIGRIRPLDNDWVANLDFFTDALDFVYLIPPENLSEFYALQHDCNAEPMPEDIKVNAP